MMTIQVTGRQHQARKVDSVVVAVANLSQSD